MTTATFSSLGEAAETCNSKKSHSFDVDELFCAHLHNYFATQPGKVIVRNVCNLNMIVSILDGIKNVHFKIYLSVKKKNKVDESCVT